MTKPRWRKTSDPDCEHLSMTRTLAIGYGFIYKNAAVFDCPECGMRDYGDEGLRVDDEYRLRYNL